MFQEMQVRNETVSRPLEVEKKQATRKNRFIVIGSWLPCMLQVGP